MSMITILTQILHRNPFDIVAVLIYLLCWIGYEPFLKKISKKSGLISKDLSVVRHAWMKEMVIRSFKMFDSNLMNHAVQSASTFSSANLLLIAAVAGVLFGGQIPIASVKQLGIDVSSPVLLEIKLALVLLCLSRGFLNFIWSIRQMNYCAAAMGSLPDNMDKPTATAFSDAMSNILEPAMSNFSQGVRGYYFALAAAAWLFGPLALIIASIGAITLLGWRQSRSQTAMGLRQLRDLLEAHPYPTPTRPIVRDDDIKAAENDAAHKDLSGF
ncbi:MAG: DUF599 family protein [Asticcacaulis sp.]